MVGSDGKTTACIDCVGSQWVISTGVETLLAEFQVSC